MTPLERRYMKLMSLFPTDHRREHSAEMVSTLLSASSPDQNWPKLNETVPLIGHAIRMRLGLAPAQPMGRLLITIGPAQLLLASLISVMAFLGAEWNPSWGKHVLPGHQMGPFQTSGVVAYFCWTIAAASLLLKNPKVTRRLVVVSMAVTAALIPLSHVITLDRPTKGFLAFLFVLGLPILISEPQRIVGYQWNRRQQVMIAASLGIAVVLAIVLVPTWDLSRVHQFSEGSYGLSPSFLFYESAIPSIATALVWIDVLALVSSAALFVVGRRVLAGSIALGGLSLLTLWIGQLEEFDSLTLTSRHLVVGCGLAVFSLLLVGFYLFNDQDEAMERAA